jgi:hypothetical protein
MGSVLPRILRIIAWSFVAYVGVVLLVVLPALNILAPRLAEDYLDRELRSELIILNPFTLALDVRRTTLLERDGHQPLGFKRLHIDLSVSSLWQPGIVFDDLRLEELDLHVLRHADGHFHFDDLLTTAESDAAQSTEADLPAVTVHDVYIGAHSLRFTDRTRPGPYTARYRDFVVSTRDVTTVPGRRGDGELLLANEEGGEIRWRGEMASADGQSAGSVTVDNLDLTHLYRYERENLSFHPPRREPRPRPRLQSRLVRGPGVHHRGRPAAPSRHGHHTRRRRRPAKHPPEAGRGIDRRYQRGQCNGPRPRRQPSAARPGSGGL